VPEVTAHRSTESVTAANVFCGMGFAPRATVSLVPKDLTPVYKETIGKGAGARRWQRPVYVDHLPPCNQACPAGQNIQAWLALAQAGDYESAWRKYMEENPLPGTHGRACYHPCESACNRQALDQPVSMIMTTGDLITADVSDDVAVAIEIFRQGRISHIPVLSEGSKLVGVVSPADILKLSTQLVPPFSEATAKRGAAAAPQGAAAPKRGRTVTRIADVMTKNIETVRPTIHLRQAAQLFISGGFHSLLVTANDGELVGILTSSDLLRALIGEYVPPSGD